MRTVHSDSARDTDSDLIREPTGQKLVEALEKALAEDIYAAKYPGRRLADTKWTRQVLQQATKVFCMAMEICNDSTKVVWQPCAYSSYQWTMEQEVGHLYACFGGPEEDETVKQAQRKAKTWLAKAHKGVERARNHIGLHLREVTETDGFSLVRQFPASGCHAIASMKALPRRADLHGASPGCNPASLPYMVRRS
jgi:hypothetical protein